MPALPWGPAKKAKAKESKSKESKEESANLQETIDKQAEEIAKLKQVTLSAILMHGVTCAYMV